MVIEDITTRDILRAIGVDPYTELPRRGDFKCYLDFYKCDLKSYKGDLFSFEVELDFPRGLHISIPNDSIKDIIHNDIMFHSTSYKFLLDYIHHNCKKSEGYPDDLVAVCFAVLHEFGHWDYFLRCGKGLEDYIKQDKPYRDAIFNMEGSSETKMLDYRNIPSEKAADSFAFNKLIDLITQRVWLTVQQITAI